MRTKKGYKGCKDTECPSCTAYNDGLLEGIVQGKEVGYARGVADSKYTRRRV